MKSLRFVISAIFALLILPSVAHAQGGCVDSPEAPTDVLMLVGSIGMVYGSSVIWKVFRKSGKR
jgi:XrtJ-associated TM-motif-TM protein